MTMFDPENYRKMHNDICIVHDHEMVRLLGIHEDSMDYYYVVKPLHRIAYKASAVGRCVSLKGIEGYDSIESMFTLNGSPPTDEFSVTIETESVYYNRLLHCLIRYEDMANDQPDLLDFIDEFRTGIDKGYPLNKLNRWLGYIQGVLIERGKTTVEAERDWTRPLFRSLDFK